MKMVIAVIALVVGNLFAQEMPPQAELICYTETLTMNGKPDGKPLPDGTEIQIFWDWDKNGPDAKDPLPVIGTEYLNANVNSLTVNGEAVELGAGKFLMDGSLFFVGGMPSPPLIYLRACIDENTSLVSDVITLKSGYEQVDVKGWKLDKIGCRKLK